MAEIGRLLEILAASAHGPDAGVGCLLCNTAIELASTIEIETLARFFTSYVLGQLTLIRSNVEPQVVESATVVALQHPSAPSVTSTLD